MLCVFYVPLAGITFLASKYLLKVIAEEEVADNAEQFILIGLFGHFFAAQFDLTRRYVYAMKVQVMPNLFQLGAAALHILWCRLFVRQFEPELRGLAAADVVTYMLQFFMLSIYA